MKIDEDLDRYMNKIIAEGIKSTWKIKDKSDEKNQTETKRDTGTRNS